MELTQLKMEDYDSNVSYEVEQMTKDIKKLKRRYSEGKLFSFIYLKYPFSQKENRKLLER
jgi:hypothetical protein